MKHWTTIEWITFGAIAAILSVIAFGIADACSGQQSLLETTVTGKHHQPAWTEHCARWVAGRDTDGDGKANTAGHTEHYTVHHPDEWWIYADGGAIAVQAGAGQFHAVEHGSAIVVGRKVGKFTGIAYPWYFVRTGTIAVE
jgi:hypothetical protein